MTEENTSETSDDVVATSTPAEAGTNDETSESGIKPAMAADDPPTQTGTGH